MAGCGCSGRKFPKFLWEKFDTGKSSLGMQTLNVGNCKNASLMFKLFKQCVPDSSCVSMKDQAI